MLLWAWLIDKVEVRHSSILICKTMGKNRKKKMLAKNRTSQRKTQIQIFNLDLRPHLVSPLSSGRGGHRATPLTRSRSPCLGIREALDEPNLKVPRF